jgi:aspartate/methionine/tyrosine aminotransferase
MQIKPFALERFFARYEFSTKYLLSSSDCDGLAQSEVLSWADTQAKGLWDNLTLGYTETTGLPLLRQEIASLYNGVDPEEILTAAPEECIFIALNTLLHPGDHVICTWPGYQSLYEIARSVGCAVTLWQPAEADGWKFDVGFLEQSVKPNTRMLIVNFPHNPTGALSSKADFDRIVQVAGKHRLYLFSDEMYRFLEYDPAGRLPPACEGYENAVSLCGMSKIFGLAGVRIGWLVVKDAALYQKLVAFKDYTTICSSAPGEILSLITLRSREKVITRHLDRIARNLDVLEDFFARHAARFSWVRPRAGTICFPRLITGESAASFCSRVLEETGIMIVPSTIFEYGDSHIRLGFGRENFPQVLSILERSLLR